MLEHVFLPIRADMLIETVLSKGTIPPIRRTPFEVLTPDAFHAFFVAFDDSFFPRVSGFIKDGRRRHEL
jgi:hypothetical protein